MDEIHLSEEDRAFVEAEVKAGRYLSAEDVVRAGLSLLQTVSPEGMDDLRRLISAGDTDFEAGDFATFSSADMLKADILARTKTLS